MKQKDRELSFEEALRQLEAIVDSLEKEEVSLEDSLARYEEGIRLYRFCMQKLTQLEGKIELLIKELDGGFSRKSFDFLGEVNDTGED